MLKNFYKNKKILITGHTGFKGIWLINCLTILGAKVYGISKNDENKKNFYKLCETKNIKSYFFDILNKKKLNTTIKKIEPDIIFHLAAQSIVRKSYKFPENTFETNFNGTLNLLSVSLKLKNLKSLIIVTSDKCYQNLNKKKFFIETDALGGDDPYSASKGASEILFNSFLKSYLINKKIGAASVRAGNVLGGGDWSVDRILPDYIKSIKYSKKFIIRNPNSSRPWQHVLDVINGYLILAMKLYKNREKYSGNWNFGPNYKKNVTVKKLIKIFSKFIEHKAKNIVFINKKTNQKESKFLNLDSSKARKYLYWNNRYDLTQILRLTAEWYNENMYKNQSNRIIKKQINNFFFNN